MYKCTLETGSEGLTTHRLSIVLTGSVSVVWSDNLLLVKLKLPVSVTSLWSAGVSVNSVREACCQYDHEIFLLLYFCDIINVTRILGFRLLLYLTFHNVLQQRKIEVNVRLGHCGEIE